MSLLDRFIELIPAGEWQERLKKFEGLDRVFKPVLTTRLKKDVSLEIDLKSSVQHSLYKDKFLLNLCSRSISMTIYHLANSPQTEIIAIAMRSVRSISPSPFMSP